jgi:RimJ/RimL family protein N-acetyltransferase
MNPDLGATLADLRLESDRLILRALRHDDALPLASLANDRRIAEGTLTMPYPYEVRDAEIFIERAREARRNATLLSNALERRSDGRFIGAMGLVLQLEYDRAELGYWLGVEFWNQGYATEAARALLNYAFREIRLNRVYATHFTDNPASGHVMRKLGMTREGLLRQHFIRFGQPKDTVYYGILRDEWLATHPQI